MFGYYPARSSPYPYSYSPYTHYPQSRAPLDLERDRYMRALAEEQAARSSYAAALARDRELQEAAAARRAHAEALQRQRQRAPQPRGYHVYSPYASRYANSSDEEFDSPYAPYSSGGAGYDEDFDGAPSDEFEAYKLREYLKNQKLEKLKEEAIAKEKLRQLEMEKRKAKDLQEFLGRVEKQHDENVPRKQARFPSAARSSAKRSPSPPSVRIPISDPEPAAKVAKPNVSSESRPKVSQPEPSKPKSRDPSPDPINHQVHAARLAALTTIDALRAQFTSLKNVFVFPLSLDFSATPSSAATDDTPRLAYTHTNAPVHAYEDALLKLLQALDAVESAGDKDVRERRRDMVRSVEAELALLDQRKVEMWKKMCGASEVVADEARKGDEVEAQSEAKDVQMEVEESKSNDIEIGKATDVVSDATLTVPATEQPDHGSSNSIDIDVDAIVPAAFSNEVVMDVDLSSKEVSSMSQVHQQMDEDDSTPKDTDIDVDVPVHSSDSPVPLHFNSVSNAVSTEIQQRDVELHTEDSQSDQSPASSTQPLPSELYISNLSSSSAPASPGPEARIREVLVPTSLSEPSTRPHSPAPSSSFVNDDEVVVEEDSSRDSQRNEEEDLIVVEETSSNPAESVQQHDSESDQDALSHSDMQSDEEQSSYPPRSVYPKADEQEHDNYVMVF